jgi:hypothetical protein
VRQFHPATNKNVFFVKYPIYVGANRGRGQVYPTGDKTNNNLFNAVASGKFRKLKLLIKTMKLLLLQLVEKQKYKQYQKN